jgi:hypothetical protein
MKKRPRIYVSTKFGIYYNGDKSRCYALQKRGMRSQIIRVLRNNPGQSGASLMRLIGYRNKVLLSKEINDMNLIFCVKLKVKSPMIIAYPSGGYYLNEDFDFIFLEE